MDCGLQSAGNGNAAASGAVLVTADRTIRRKLSSLAHVDITARRAPSEPGAQHRSAGRQRIGGWSRVLPEMPRAARGKGAARPRGPCSPPSPHSRAPCRTHTEAWPLDLQEAACAEYGC